MLLPLRAFDVLRYRSSWMHSINLLSLNRTLLRSVTLLFASCCVSDAALLTNETICRGDK